MFSNLPLNHPRPDGNQLVDILMGRRTDAHPPMVEYLVDDEVMRPILTEMYGRTWVDDSSNRESQKTYFDNLIFFWYQMGYSFVRYELGIPFEVNWLVAPDVVPGSRKQRTWMDQHKGLINSWDDFERYRWPAISEVDFFPFEYMRRRLPEGMGLVVSHDCGVMEHLSMLMSYEGLCYALYDNPDLVKAVSDRVGELMVSFYEQVLGLENLIAVFPGDDMGFRSGTLIKPEDLRKYVLPWHKRFAELAHISGLPYFLHSCGNILSIMEVLIDNVRIDGKHSFEDAILPVETFQAHYGDRIATLGGVDINILAGGTPDQVREKTRSLIDSCGHLGRYAIGSGNSIPSFIPVINYLTMIDEALNR